MKLSPRPVRLSLSYLVTCWGKAEDQYKLLWSVLETLSANSPIEEDFLEGDLKKQGRVPTQVAQPDGVLQNISEFWSTLGNQIRPSVSRGRDLGAFPQPQAPGPRRLPSPEIRDQPSAGHGRSPGQSDGQGEDARLRRGGLSQREGAERQTRGARRPCPTPPTAMCSASSLVARTRSKSRSGTAAARRPKVSRSRKTAPVRNRFKSLP